MLVVRERTSGGVRNPYRFVSSSCASRSRKSNRVGVSSDLLEKVLTDYPFQHDMRMRNVKYRSQPNLARINAIVVSHKKGGFGAKKEKDKILKISALGADSQKELGFVGRNEMFQCSYICCETYR